MTDTTVYNPNKADALVVIQRKIGDCKDAIEFAVELGATPDDIMTTVADAIGLDLDSIPPMFMGPVRNAMMMALRK